MRGQIEKWTDAENSKKETIRPSHQLSWGISEQNLPNFNCDIICYSHPKVIAHQKLLMKNEDWGKAHASKMLLTIFFLKLPMYRKIAVDFLSDPGVSGVWSMGLLLSNSLSIPFCRLNWCDSSWWRYQFNTNSWWMVIFDLQLGVLSFGEIKHELLNDLSGQY